MDINRYEAFVAAVDTASMSGAAKQLGYTPSGIIRLINSLEGELGFPVLVRNSTGVSPTPEGKKLLPLFRKMLATNAQMQQTSARIRGLAEGNLTIGALFSVASTWLPKGDPLSKHAALLLAEFDGKPYIRIHPEGETFAEKLMRQRYVEPDIRFTATDCFTAYSMVRAGLGLTLCCNGLAEVWGARDICVRPLSPQQYMDFGVATLPTATISPAVEEFIATAQMFQDTWPNSKNSKKARA